MFLLNIKFFFLSFSLLSLNLKMPFYECVIYFTRLKIFYTSSQCLLSRLPIKWIAKTPAKTLSISLLKCIFL
ncbi:unnamed protein product [Meloidogyne enterolobii]|uniref:Uncharacterized protein n=1 Tax=Meloidogyne enterolobii TaxID=390850 RepID=A0ACB0XKY3_MELEN